jgi:transcription initiation factor TFIIIB Brf1 subunit/transcription initiation factor TFIIB
MSNFDNEGDVCQSCGADSNLYETDEGEYLCDDCGSSSGEVKEGVSFDKFMDRILLSEGNKTKMKVVENPNRKRAATHQDRPLNRIRYGK